MRRIFALVSLAGALAMVACQPAPAYIATPTKTPPGPPPDTQVPSETPPPSETPIPPTVTATPLPTATPAPVVISVFNVDQLTQAATDGLGLPGQIAFSPLGEQLAVISDSGLWILNPNDLDAAPERYEDFDGGGQALLYAPDGQTIYFAADDDSVRSWNLQSDEDLVYFSDASVNVLARNPEGSLLAAGDQRGRISLIDPSGETETERLAVGWPILSLGIGPGGAIMASGGTDGRLWMWDLAERDVLSTLGEQGTLHALDFSPDGIFVVTGSADGVVRLFDVLWAGSRRRIEFEGHSSAVLTLAFNPDGSIIASGGSDGLLKLWDMFTGDLVAELTMTENADITSVAWSPDGTRLAAMDSTGTLSIWQIAPVE